MIKRISWLLLLFLCGCAGQAGPREPLSAAVETAPAESVEQKALSELRTAAASLPGAELGEGEPLTIRYPGQTLFSKGAALPLAGGVWMLDPLASFLAGEKGARWQGTVRAATGVSVEYDLLLAQKRAELLGRYFGQRGLGADRLILNAEAGGGPAFELVLQD